MKVHLPYEDLSSDTMSRTTPSLSCNVQHLQRPLVLDNSYLRSVDVVRLSSCSLPQSTSSCYACPHPCADALLDIVVCPVIQKPARMATPRKNLSTHSQSTFYKEHALSHFLIILLHQVLTIFTAPDSHNCEYTFSILNPALS